MYYPDEVIEEVRMKNDIVDVISGYVKLQKKGANYFGLCPFHNEKSPSFSVSPGKQMYYCFGCGAGGNVLTFVMEYENYTFQEALQSLADRAGVTLPKMEYSKEAREQAELRSRLLEVNKLAANYFYYQMKQPQGEMAYEYFHDKRKLTDEIMLRFGLGYSNKTSDDLYRFLKDKGYDEGFSASICAAAGTIGVIIPPSIPFVIYGVATGTSIGDMFKAGVIPGLLMGLALMLYNWATSKKYGWKGNGRKFNFKALGKSFIDSFWAILSPVIILGGIYGGFFTPTEAAAVSCVYTFIIGTFVYKEIHWKEFVDCMKDTVVIAGATSFIVGMSTSFAYVMTLEQVPETLSAFILGISDNKIIILLLMNVFLLVVGMFMDNISSCTILAPILLPVAVALGVNPVHFGIVMTMNLAIGFITPPYGVNLFVGSSVAHIPFERIVKWIWPFIGVIIVVLLLTTYIPQLSLLLV